MYLFRDARRVWFSQIRNRPREWFYSFCFRSGLFWCCTRGICRTLPTSFSNSDGGTRAHRVSQWCWPSCCLGKWDIPTRVRCRLRRIRTIPLRPVECGPPANHLRKLWHFFPSNSTPCILFESREKKQGVRHRTRNYPYSVEKKNYERCRIRGGRAQRVSSTEIWTFAFVHVVAAIRH